MVASAGLMPDAIRACLFDLDGVLTQTSRVHAAAWKRMFDAFLLDWSRRTGEPFRPFEVPAEYAAYVDGKLRQDGVRSFLTSPGIVLEDASPDDLPSMETVHGLGTRKNDLVLDLIRYPEQRQSLTNVTNGKLLQLRVDDKPFDVRYGGPALDNLVEPRACGRRSCTTMPIPCRSTDCSSRSACAK